MKAQTYSRAFSKRLALLLAIGIGLSGTYSCNKFLNVEPKESIAQELAITDKSSLNTAIRGTYRSLGASGYYGSNFVTNGFHPSGDMRPGTNTSNLMDINFRSDDGAFLSFWTAAYNTINLANTILAKAPEITDVTLTETEKNTIVGEAHFIRALAYFDLARSFGGVPLKLTPTTDVTKDIGIPRSTRAETYDQVLNDLNQAESILPETVNRIRATKHAVWALKARYYLYNEQWADAVKYATDVIDQSSSYELLTPFSAWFKGGVQTRESIFELSFSPQNPATIREAMNHPNNGGTYRYSPLDHVVALLQSPVTGGQRLALIDSVQQGGITLYQGALYHRSPDINPAYILRIAEQYLIRAEARAKLGDLEGAISDINIIRTRAGLADTDAKTQDEVLLAIDQERRLEFLWEAHRYFDLARTGRLKEVIEGLDPARNVGSHNYVFPIPIEQILLDPALEQNPGY